MHLPLSDRADREYSAQYDFESLSRAIPDDFAIEFTFLDPLLDEKTAVLAAGHDAVCIFVNDVCTAAVVEQLHALGVVRPGPADPPRAA